MSQPETDDDVPPMPGVECYEAAPIRTREQAVRSDWIDYNGHMNVAYYTLAFDKASDTVWDEMLGVGEALAKLGRMGPMVVQQQIHYIGELLEGERFYTELQVLDWSEKAIHLFQTMRKVSDDALCATSETLSFNVDLQRRRTAPYPDWALSRVRAMGEAHQGLPRPEQAGRTIAIRRRS
ncbi:MAG: thioesterase family protein [Pseudomonadota bacterium]